MEKIKSFVSNEIYQLIGLEQNEELLSLSLRENGADSLDIFQIVSDVEEQFSVDIKDKINTGNDIVRIAYDQLKDKNQ